VSEKHAASIAGSGNAASGGEGSGKAMSTPQTASREEIMQAERALYRAQIAGDVAELAPMLDDDLVYIHSTGVAESKEQYLAGVAERLYEYGMIQSHGTRVIVFDALATINGIVEMTVSAHGAPKELIRLLFCLIWIRRHDGWRLTFRQATRMPPIRY
jgi:hypothetical protein